LSRAPEQTRALLAPPIAQVSDDERAMVRDRLISGIAPVADRLAVGTQVQITLALLRRARSHPDALAHPEEPFAWKPAFVRRSLGLAMVNACLDGRHRTLAEAAGPVAAEAVSEWRQTGWRTFHWEPWMAGLPVGARAVVLADAVTWATSLWSSFDWSAFPGRPQVGGVDEQWVCPAVRSVRLKSRAELRVPLARFPSRSPSGPDSAPSPAALVSLVGGTPHEAWPDELAFLALVAGLRSPARPVPVRVVGVWPDAGTYRTMEIDGAALTRAADRVITTVSALADARQPADVAA
jgi:hypothetical protein